MSWGLGFTGCVRVFFSFLLIRVRKKGGLAVRLLAIIPAAFVFCKHLWLNVWLHAWLAVSLCLWLLVGCVVSFAFLARTWIFVIFISKKREKKNQLLPFF